MDYTIEEKRCYEGSPEGEAEIALAQEIPIGCVIVKDGGIIGRGHGTEECNERSCMRR